MTVDTMLPSVAVPVFFAEIATDPLNTEPKPVRVPRSKYLAAPAGTLVAVFTMGGLAGLSAS